VNEPHDELVTLWTSGEGPERRAALEHVRGCEVCRAASAQLGLALDALEGGTVGRVEARPPSGSVERLLQRARSDTGRVAYFAGAVAQLFDLSPAAADELLSRSAGAEGWEDGPGPGVKLFPVAAGPRLGEALTALVRLDAGATFPHHPHAGPEEVLVLEGGYRDSSGLEVWRGEAQQMSAGSEHSFVAFAGVGCLCASVILLERD
jgi:putative transcriptional regulator